MTARCRFDQRAGGGAFELVGQLGELTAGDLGEVAGVLEEVEARAVEGRWLGGFVSYEAAPAFDPSLQVRELPADAAGASLPLAWFGVFEGCAPGAPEAVRSADPETAPWGSELDAAAHAAGVAAIREAIAGGEVYLVNYTTRLRRPWPQGADPRWLYEQVRAAHDGGLHAYLETADWAVACGSPELFFELDAGTVTTRPMKGTAARGRWLAEDLERAVALQTSDKERAENVMVVDLLRNDLGRIAEVGSVRVPRLWQVERYPTVWQLTSMVTARAPGTSLTGVFTALFPSGSVTGAPKIAAMRVAAEQEVSPRGVYCGAVGVVRPSTAASSGARRFAARFAVAIRTAVVDKRRGLAEYGSGGGITWDSLAAAEWEEVATKAASLTSGAAAAAGSPGPRAGLVETMRVEGGEILRLDGHLRRLAASAFCLGYPPPVGVAGKLRAGAAACPTTTRLRLVWHRDATATLEATPVELPGPDAPPLRLCVDPEPVRSTDRSLFHKTTDRARYELRAARHPDADDVVLVNEHGEVTETTRANLVVRLDGHWCTPALDCGLLPGVERDWLVSTGQVEERRITVAELDGAPVATVSSLRGWRSATVAACPHPAGRRPALSAGPPR